MTSNNSLRLTLVLARDYCIITARLAVTMRDEWFMYIQRRFFYHRYAERVNATSLNATDLTMIQN